MRLGICPDVALQELACVADGGKQQNSRNYTEKLESRLRRSSLR
jgi:hypothetical protein